MPRFFRRVQAPGPFVDYRRYKPALREDFRFQCAYCNISEGYRKGADVFAVDHFRPQSRFPELTTVYANLYYACLRCNSTKGNRFPDERLLALGICYVDPCAVDPFGDDLTEQADGNLSGRTPSGRFTIDAIRLNRAECVLFRQRRLGVFARIQRLKGEVAEMPLRDPGRLLAEDAIVQAEAEWAECYGVLPRVNG